MYGKTRCLYAHFTIYIALIPYLGFNYPFLGVNPKVRLFRNDYKFFKKKNVEAKTSTF